MFPGAGQSDLTVASYTDLFADGKMTHETLGHSESAKMAGMESEEGRPLVKA